MTELEQAQSAVETANDNVSAALEADPPNSVEFAERVAEAYQARSLAWSVLLRVMHVDDLHPVYVHAVSAAAVADAVAAETWRMRAEGRCVR